MVSAGMVDGRMVCMMVIRNGRRYV
jgi:hypothetical protein